MRGLAGDVRPGGRRKVVNGLAGTLSGAGVLGALAGIAVVDARRMVIRLDLVALLMATGIVWLALGGGMALLGTGWAMHAVGAALGAGMPLALILLAEAAGRRWPIYPGDAVLLCAVGGILGLRAFLWALVLGCSVAVLHMTCLQTRRGRPLTRGYLPAGPGLAIGAAVVFLGVNAGAALSAESKGAAGDDRVAIVATELLPANPALPDELTGKRIRLEGTVPLPFEALVAAIGRAAGIQTAIEERPARVAGGAVRLPEPEPVLPGDEAELSAVLNGVASRAGYAWEWADGRVVFYRYWDSGWPGAPVDEAAEPPVVDGPVERVWTWLGRVFGGEERPAGEPVVWAESETARLAGEDVPSKTAQEASVGVPDEAEVPEGLPGSREAAAGSDRVAAGDRPTGAARVVAAVADVPAVETWKVDPVSQKTLRGVLESWAAKAEWKVDWRTGRDFSVGAAAAFEGSFLKAVDGLFSDPQVSRVLLVSAHANRYLVVRGAGR